jgi:DNA-binding response OmpR family regulator
MHVAASLPARPLGRIVVADDDPVFRRLVALALREDGYTVVEAEDGEELVGAIERTARTGELAAVVSDVCMPRLGGLDVLAVLRCAAWRTPVVLMTAFGEEETRAEARELGAAAVLEKPFAIDALRETVRDATRCRNGAGRVRSPACPPRPSPVASPRSTGPRSSEASTTAAMRPRRRS